MGNLFVQGTPRLRYSRNEWEITVCPLDRSFVPPRERRTCGNCWTQFPTFTNYWSLHFWNIIQIQSLTHRTTLQQFCNLCCKYWRLAPPSRNFTGQGSRVDKWVRQNYRSIRRGSSFSIITEWREGCLWFPHPQRQTYYAHYSRMKLCYYLANIFLITISYLNKFHCVKLQNGIIVFNNSTKHSHNKLQIHSISRSVKLQNVWCVKLRLRNFDTPAGIL